MAGSNSIDVVSNSDRSIEEPHAFVHDGKMYCATDYVSLANAASQAYCIIPGTTVGINSHLAFKVRCTGAMSVVFSGEGSAAITGTTAVTVIRNNRTLTMATATTIIKPDSVTNAGGTLYSYASADALEFSFGDGEEFVLLPGAKYILTVTNTSGSTATVSVAFRWYDTGSSTELTKA